MTPPAKKIAAKPRPRRKPPAHGSSPPWLVAFESGASEAIADFFAPDLVLHFSDSLLRRLPGGLAGLQQLAALLKTAFPDLKWQVLATSGQGQTHVYTCSAQGTHRGLFLRVQPTGRRVAFPGRFMVRTAGDLIVEMWIRSALTTLLPQLGMAPEVPSR
jgi:predicted ester cyclase